MNGFKRINFEDVYLGDLLTLPGYQVFFGTRGGTWDLVQRAFPEFKFCRLKQVHGNSVLKADPSSQNEGDGHWTTQNNLALTIVTADCMPIMGISPSAEYVFALHAGWRGVAQEILPVALKEIPVNELQSFKLFIGPHIFKDSFEVGQDVASQLSQGASPHPKDKAKALVDLLKIVKIQASTFGVTESNIFSIGQNTFTSDYHSSYRRDKPNAGRQISFVCKTN